MDTEMLALHTRLGKVERMNQRLRLIGGATVILMIAALALLVAQKQRGRTLEAEQFILRDGKGEIRGGLVVGPEGPSLDFYDSNHMLRLALSIVGDMPNLTIKDARGTGAVVLADAPTGPGLMLYDRNGDPRAQLDVGKEGPRLYLEDQQGFAATVGNFLSDDPAKNRKLRAASVVLSQKNLGIIWHAP